VISTHIDLATGHGIDFFLVSWWGPRYGQDGYIDANLQDHFLTNPLIKDIKFAITYESLGRLREHHEGTEPRIDLSDRFNIQTLLSDFDYLEKYFQHPQYLKINGRLVIFLYLSRVYTGDIQGTIEKLRENHDLYLLGDQLYWQSPYDPHQQELMRLFDGITAYNIYTAVPEILENFEERVDQKYGEWYDVTQKLGIDLFLNVIPGYDDTAYKFRSPNPVLARSPERFMRLLNIALKYCDKLIITSANEWHEYTGIFPTKEKDLLYLEILRQTLATH